MPISFFTLPPSKVYNLILSITLMVSMNITGFAGPIEEYPAFFDGNGGMFNCYMDGIISTDFYGEVMQPGQTLGGVPNAVLTDPVFWDSSRKFLGWMPNATVDHGDGTFDYVPLTDNPITTAEALSYVMPKHMILFVAQWEGEDSDYFSSITLHGFGGKIPCTYLVGTPDGMTYEDGESEEMWYYLKENDESFATQVSNDFIIKGDPVKEGATFEGWMELSIEGEGENSKYTLVSNNFLTTEEICNMTTRQYETCFVAKWSDVAMSEYSTYFNFELIEDEFVLGNVDENPNIDASDALMILKHAAKLETLEGTKIDAADVNGDNSVDASDALEILKYAAKIISEFSKNN